jgi:hypothetical protein
MSMKNLSDTIENRNRDLPCAPQLLLHKENIDGIEIWELNYIKLLSNIRIYIQRNVCCLCGVQKARRIMKSVECKLKL